MKITRNWRTSVIIRYVQIDSFFWQCSTSYTAILLLYIGINHAKYNVIIGTSYSSIYLSREYNIFIFINGNLISNKDKNKTK